MPSRTGTHLPLPTNSMLLIATFRRSNGATPFHAIDAAAAEPRHLHRLGHRGECVLLHREPRHWLPGPVPHVLRPDADRHVFSVGIVEHVVEELFVFGVAPCAGVQEK